MSNRGPSNVAPNTPSRNTNRVINPSIASSTAFSTSSGGSGTAERPSKCNKCHLPITGAQFVRVGEHSFHKDCFHCPICRCSLTNIKPRAKDGIYYCPEDYQKLFCHICHTCGERITAGGLVKALGTYFHSHHFVCFQCKTPFGDGRYYEFAGQPYCPHHAPTNNSNTSANSADPSLNNNRSGSVSNNTKPQPHLSESTCTRCSLPIHDYDVISLKGLSFHTKCLHCDHCKCELSGEHSVVYKDGFVLCRDDYIKLYSRLCTACGDPILKQIVSINGESYHPDCFCCQTCYPPTIDRTKIKPTTLTHYLEQNGQLTCSTHKDIKTPPGPCSVCSLPISNGWVVRTCGKKVHETCFKCHKCKTPLEKHSTRLFNGSLCCIPCLAATGFSDTIGEAVMSYFTEQQKAMVQQTPSSQHQATSNNTNTTASSLSLTAGSGTNNSTLASSQGTSNPSLNNNTSIISNQESPPPPGSHLVNVGSFTNTTPGSGTVSLQARTQGHQRQQSQFVLPLTNPASTNYATPSTPQFSHSPMGGFNLANGMMDFNNFSQSGQSTTQQTIAQPPSTVHTPSSQGPLGQAPQQPMNNQSNIFRPSPLQVSTNNISSSSTANNNQPLYSQRPQLQQVPSTPSHHIYHNHSQSFGPGGIPEHRASVTSSLTPNNNSKPQLQPSTGSLTPSLRPSTGSLGQNNQFPPPLQMNSSHNAPPAPNKQAPSTPRGSVTPLSGSTSFGSSNSRLSKLPPSQQAAGAANYPNSAAQSTISGQSTTLQPSSIPLTAQSANPQRQSSTSSNATPSVPIVSINSPTSISSATSNDLHEQQRLQSNKLQAYHEQVQKQKQQQHNLTPQQRSVLDSYQNPPIPSPGEKYLAPANREQIQAQREKAAQLRKQTDQQRAAQLQQQSAAVTPISPNSNSVVSPGGFASQSQLSSMANMTPKFAAPSSYGGMSASAVPLTPSALSGLGAIDLVSSNNCSVEWKRGELIGKGSFGKVYMGMNSSNGELIAIKQVNISGPEDVENINQIQTEIALMSTLSHPNVIKFLGTQRSGQKLNILMEYVPGKSIDVLLATFGPFSEKVMVSYTRQLLDALAYCHDQGVVHRDIKGKNVLVDTNGHLKLADFGSAKRTISADARDSPSLGYNYTPLWTAPEVLVGDYNSKVDIWSLGCVVIEMASGKAPWSEHNFEHPFRALYHIANTTETPKLPDRLSPLGRDFISKCLIRDPDLRPSARDLLNHPWVAL